MTKIKGLELSKELRREIKKYQDLYFIAKAEYETIKEIDEENKIKILANNIFTDDDGERVLTRDYLIADDQFNEFLDLLFKENKASGLQVTDPDKVVTYESWKRMLDIEKKLFELQLETIPAGLRKDIEKAQQHHKYREKALDLILRLSV